MFAAEVACAWLPHWLRYGIPWIKCYVGIIFLSLYAPVWQCVGVSASVCVGNACWALMSSSLWHGWGIVVAIWPLPLLLPQLCRTNSCAHKSRLDFLERLK